jgi:hypothetical protein
MSMQAINWALVTPTGSPLTKVLLIAVANYANENDESYPSIERLAQETDMSKSTVKRKLAELADMGLLVRSARGGEGTGRQTNRYKLIIGDAMAQSEPGGLGVTQTLARGQSEGGLGSPVSPKPNNQKTKDSLPSPDGDGQPTTKPSKDAPGMRPEVDQLCDLLADRIEKNTGERPRITNDWRRQCRLMLDVDGRTVEKITKCIEWCQADPFWMTNILGMPKLRKQYTQLQMRALAEQNKVATVHHLRPEPKPAAPTEGQTVTDPAAYAW